ncbi:MAG: winged helix-turn-helix transcriptional regulator [Mycobacterium leprae]
MSYEQMCPKYEKAIELLGKKWTGLLIRMLLGGPKRFGEFRQQVPALNDRVLSERLRELEEQGVVRRIVHDTKPVLIEYELTDVGRGLEPVVESIQHWAERWVTSTNP